MASTNPESSAKIEISVDDLLKSRDAIVTGLTTLTSAINELIRSYIAHTNDILRDAGVQSSSLSAPNGLLDMSMNSLFAPGAEIKLGKKGMMLLNKPKKERKLRDPNAPKRPLTAYFLYSQSARTIVKGDLGPAATAAEVSSEVLRRWNDMSTPEKEGWKQVYEKNAEAYRKEVEEYKAQVASSLAALELDADADADGEPDHEAPAVAAAAVAAAESSDDSSSEEEAKPVAPPPKKTKAAGKKKAASPSPSAQLHGDVPAAPAPTGPPKQTPIPLPNSNAEKKRKKDAADEEERKSKKAKKEKSSSTDKKEKKEKKEKKKKNKEATF